jgi:hypothetical protein
VQGRKSGLKEMKQVVVNYKRRNNIFWSACFFIAGRKKKVLQRIQKRF